MPDAVAGFGPVAAANTTVDTAPASSPIRDINAVPAAPLAGEPVANITPPRAPTLSGAVIDAPVVTLVYDEDLDTGSVPAADGFAVTAAGAARPVTAAADTEQFTFAPPVGGDYTVTVTVTAGGDTLTDTATLSVFGDIAGHQFADDIVWLAEQGITRGCAPNRYCPQRPVTRAQMAAFLNRARHLIAAARTP